MSASTILCGLVAWGCIALALGIAIGKAIKVADAREAADRAARLAHHPSARQLTEAEVQQRIREMERRWVS